MMVESGQTLFWGIHFGALILQKKKIPFYDAIFFFCFWSLGKTVVAGNSESNVLKLPSNLLFHVKCVSANKVSTFNKRKEKKRKDNLSLYIYILKFYPLFDN